jgi:hypothetical protein
LKSQEQLSKQLINQEQLVKKYQEEVKNLSSKYERQVGQWGEKYGKLSESNRKLVDQLELEKQSVETQLLKIQNLIQNEALSISEIDKLQHKQDQLVELHETLNSKIVDQEQLIKKYQDQLSETRQQWVNKEKNLIDQHLQQLSEKETQLKQNTVSIDQLQREKEKISQELSILRENLATGTQFSEKQVKIMLDKEQELLANREKLTMEQESLKKCQKSLFDVEQLRLSQEEQWLKKEKLWDEFKLFNENLKAQYELDLKKKNDEIEKHIIMESEMAETTEKLLADKRQQLEFESLKHEQIAKQLAEEKERQLKSFGDKYQKQLSEKESQKLKHLLEKEQLLADKQRQKQLAEQQKQKQLAEKEKQYQKQLSEGKLQLSEKDKLLAEKQLAEQQKKQQLAEKEAQYQLKLSEKEYELAETQRKLITKISLDQNPKNLGIGQIPSKICTPKLYKAKQFCNPITGRWVNEGPTLTKLLQTYTREALETYRDDILNLNK